MPFILLSPVFLLPISYIMSQQQRTLLFNKTHSFVTYHKSGEHTNRRTPSTEKDNGLQLKEIASPLHVSYTGNSSIAFGYNNSLQQQNKPLDFSPALDFRISTWRLPSYERPKQREKRISQPNPLPYDGTRGWVNFFSLQSLPLPSRSPIMGRPSSLGTITLLPDRKFRRRNYDKSFCCFPARIVILPLGNNANGKGREGHQVLLSFCLC